VDGVRVRFRFHGDLNDFLEPALRNREFEALIGHTDNLKHAVESLGAPHTAVASIHVHGERAEWTKKPPEGALVEVFPHAAPRAYPESGFVLDGHLGRLAAYLRMLGFDVWYERNADDAQLASIAGSEKRLLITRDIGLLKRNEVARGYWVRATAPLAQLREVWDRYGLHSHMRPFTRCMVCNGRLQPVAKQEVADRLPPRVRETHSEFRRCAHCGRVFWPGSHYARMRGWIEELTADMR
jgi:uncharacterized protein with PIN domain